MSNVPLPEPDIVERLRERIVTNWIYRTRAAPRWDGVKQDPLCAEAADEIERLRAEVAGLREDAERYRWLRDKQAYIGIHPHYKDLPIEQRSGWTIRLVPDVKNSFDAAIDAARKGEA